jgi:lysophospholipid acyltransferase (LPLAT)-like uncharacterized protein
MYFGKANGQADCHLIAERRKQVSMATGNSFKAVLIGLTAAALTAILRAWCWSWRKDARQLEKLQRLSEGGTPVLAIFWHGKYFPLFALAEGLHATVFAGNSFRGEVIAQLSRRFGYDAQLIGSNHDGRSGDRIRMVYRSAKLGALAVDGPLGPFHVVNEGAVALASELGLLVVPVSVAGDPKMVLASRWDRRELPLPFARVALVVSDPITVPRGLGRWETAEWAAKIRSALDKADRQADGLIG